MTDEKRCAVQELHREHEDIVEVVKAELPDEGLISGVVEIFKLLGDSTRLKILMALEISEMCVSCIGSSLDMSDSAVSHQLRSLKESNLIKSRRAGKYVYYSLSDDHVKSLIDITSEHILEDV
ncbi:MAG TPA: metalloregulator ArsR/SmtB family transcription factor [Candidatus Methanomethylophilaceae archaeon]|nr:metalloregulator ArsR/SmtB family transcription factor [Candidatus Methanomethylophilaceae archaeon]